MISYFCLLEYLIFCIIYIKKICSVFRSLFPFYGLFRDLVLPLCITTHGGSGHHRDSSRCKHHHFWVGVSGYFLAPKQQIDHGRYIRRCCYGHRA